VSWVTDYKKDRPSGRGGRDPTTRPEFYIGGPGQSGPWTRQRWRPDRPQRRRGRRSSARRDRATRAV